jgi:hypothetical protein
MKLLKALEIFGKSRAERLVVVENVSWIEGEILSAHADKLIGFRTGTADYLHATAHDLREAFGIPFSSEADK